jgi:hypothetical protein
MEVATHVVAAFTKESLNPATDAVRQVISAAEAQRRDWLTRQRPTAAVFVVAAVVTSAPLLACSITREGELQLSRVDHFAVWGHTAEGKRRRVVIMNEGHLPSFASSLARMAEVAGEEAEFRRTVRE